ncbi:MAG: Crp/Fnr family transcriptional regulator [Flavobacteriia bacterium]|jgi:CRP-like cAMP-binding protein
MILKKYCSKEWCDFVEFHSKTVILQEGEFIFKSGEKTEGLFIIIDGKVKISTNSGEKNERVIRLATNDDLLGHRGFGGSWEYTVSATCLTTTKLLFIPMAIFNDLVKGNPDFAYFMIIFFAEELRETENLASLRPIKNIIASVLLRNYKVFGIEENETSKLSYTLSRKDMASLAGTRYETLVRTLAEFNNENIIKIDGKSIHILDVSKLEELARHQD